MKISKNISFTKQLIIYLASALFIVFLSIYVVLYHSLQQFIENNTYNYAQIIADNILVIFEQEIIKIEEIPNSIAEIKGVLDDKNVPDLPVRILKSHPNLIGCSIHYDPEKTKATKKQHVTAIRENNGSIHAILDCTPCDFCHPDSSRIIRRNNLNGYWLYSQFNNIKTLAYCQPIYDKEHSPCGVMKIDFLEKTITNLICNHKLFKNGYLFVADDQGNYLAHTLSKYKNIETIFSGNRGERALQRKTKLISGETGNATVTLGNIKYYTYFTPIHLMNWRLGIICPYNEILLSSNTLYVILLICLGMGTIFLCIGIIQIVRRSTYPLKYLAYSTRRIAEGQFDIELTAPKSSKEINELCDSFRYMQTNLINFIARLKATTVEKESMHAEMNMAHRIQQHFLPKQIQLPDNIELSAKLQQSNKVGGDLYEYILIDHQLFFATGDVCGKGMPAALYMASVSNLFRYIVHQHHSVAKICNVLNTHMCENRIDDMYITMFVGVLDINTGIMTYTNAGHPYPIVIRENTTSYCLDKFPETPIGILDSFVFTEHTFTLPKNTTLLFYTDGITDMENPEGVFYGQNRMNQCIKSIPDNTPEKIIQAIIKEIDIHLNQHKQSDDLMVLALRYKGVPKRKNDTSKQTEL